MFVLDTCAVSEITKPLRNEGFWVWLEGVPQQDVCVTMITLAEIAYGIERLPIGKRRNQISLALGAYLDSLEVLVLSREAASLTGRLLAAREREGRPMQFADAAIAAIALHTGATLVTRDTHFDGISEIPGFEQFKCLVPWSSG